MFKVVCTNDKNLPPGADIKKGEEYTVILKYPNNFDDLVYILAEANNEGKTKFGFKWIGYKSTRFSKPEEIILEETEQLEEAIWEQISYRDIRDFNLEYSKVLDNPEEYRPIGHIECLVRYAVV